MRTLIYLLLIWPAVSMGDLPLWKTPPMAHYHLLSAESVKNFNTFLKKYRTSHLANVMWSAPIVTFQKGSATTPDTMVAIAPYSTELDILTIDPTGKLEIRSLKPNFPERLPTYHTQITFGHNADYGRVGFSLKYPLQNIGFASNTYHKVEDFFEIRQDGSLAVKTSIADIKNVTVRADIAGRDSRSIKLSSANSSLETPVSVLATPRYGTVNSYSNMDCTIRGGAMGQSAGAVIQIESELAINADYYIQCKDRSTGQVKVTFRIGSDLEFDGLMTTHEVYELYQNDHYFDGVIKVTLLQNSIQHEKLETSKIYDLPSDAQGSIQHLQVDPISKQLVVTMSTGKVYRGQLRFTDAVVGSAQLVSLKLVELKKPGFFRSLCESILAPID